MLDESLQPQAVESSKLPLEEFLVFYSLSGVLLARAASAEEAGEKVTGDLRTLIAGATQVGIGPTEAVRIRLGEAEVNINSVEMVIYQCQPEESEYPTTMVTGLPDPSEVAGSETPSIIDKGLSDEPGTQNS